MTDAIDLLKIRRSVKPREMGAPGPSPAELDTILTIGARVPDHGKLTPWRFIIFEGDARVRAGEVIAKVFARKNPAATPDEIEVEKRRLTDAPLVIGVVSFTKPHPKVPAWEQELSAGASSMNIVTAATALGYGACWLTGWFAFDRDVLDALGIEGGRKARRLHSHRHAVEAERGPPTAAAWRYRDAVLVHLSPPRSTLQSIFRHSPMCNRTSWMQPSVGNCRPEAQARKSITPIRGYGSGARPPSVRPQAGPAGSSPGMTGSEFRKLFSVLQKYCLTAVRARHIVIGSRPERGASCDRHGRGAGCGGRGCADNERC